MTGFVTKVISFSLLQLAIFAILVTWKRPGRRYEFCAVTVAKHDQLQRQLHGETVPRLLLAGGSSTCFGVDCEVLAASLRYRPMNLSLTALHGLDFILNEAAEAAISGDQIVLLLEYEHFYKDLTYAPIVLKTIQFRPASARFVSLAQWKTMADRALMNFTAELRGRFRETNTAPRYQLPVDPRHIFIDYSFNLYGDFTGHHDCPSAYQYDATRRPSPPADPRQISATVTKLNQFANRCRQRQVDVLLGFPPIAVSEFRLKRNNIQLIHEIVKRDLKIPVLYAPDKSTYRDDLFHDTGYHLSKAGKQRHTRLLQRQLQPDRITASARRSGQRR